MSTRTCDFLLAQDLVSDCSNPVVQGVRNKGIIANYDDVDWDVLAKDNTNPNIVKTLAMKSGKKAYEIYIDGKTPFTGTQTEMSAGTYRNDFTKTVSLVVLNNGASVAHNIIDKLANGKFIVILENKFGGNSGDNIFEIYGLEQGLSASEMSSAKYSEDTEGGWAVTLVEENAPTSGMYVFNTDVATTRTAVESLLTTQS